MKKVYIAAPFGKIGEPKRHNAESAAIIMEKKGFEVYCPWKNIIPHAWDYPNIEWGQMVFANDMVIVLSYGRESTAGTNWEAGYAFGIGKTVVLVEMTDKVMSLMVANGRWATLRGLHDLEDYDFEQMIKCRTVTEVK